jgi:CubicO group peptidase (beta-lactamase class C family)
LAAWALATAAAQAATPVPLAQVDAIFADYDSTRTPGCALGVIENGELTLARGYGMANLDDGVPLGPGSVFRIASTSKQFTAFSIQLLVDRGLVDLEADIRSYLPELPAYDPPVKVRHLLNHTSGYRDYLELNYLAGTRDDDYYTDAEVLDLLSRQKQLNFAPGAEFLYSNSGYFLLGQIVLRVTGRTLREFAAAEIFAPLEMRHTHFHDNHREVVAGRAVGYSPTAPGEFEIDLTTLEMIGDGGVFTSVEDLALWDANFYTPRVGTPATLQRMLEPGRLTSGEAIDYASGLRVSDYRGLRQVSHGGAFVGYRAQLIRFPDQRLSVVCLCNRSDADPSALAQRVADLYLAEPLARHLARQQVAGEDGAIAEAAAEATSEATQDTPAAAVEAYLPSVETVARIAGDYRCDELMTTVRLRAEGTNLWLAHANPYKDGPAEPLAPSRPNTFASDELTLEIDEGEQGEVVDIRLGVGRVRNVFCVPLP